MAPIGTLFLQLLQDSGQIRVDANLKHVLQNAKCSLPLASGFLQMLKSAPRCESLQFRKVQHHGDEHSQLSQLIHFLDLHVSVWR